MGLECLPGDWSELCVNKTQPRSELQPSFSADEWMGREVLKGQHGVASPVPARGSALGAIPGEEELQARDNIV